MTNVTADECGRITIPQEIRERFGEEYRLVELESSIRLIPIPENPVDALQSAASEEFESTSTEELRDAARLQGREDNRESRRE